jgi:hypothetical protein
MESPRMNESKNDISKKWREKLDGLMNQRVAAARLRLEEYSLAMCG